MKIICPKCKGKKTIFDKTSLLLTVGLPIAWLMDDDTDEKSITRERCPQCKGKGKIKL